MPKYHIEYVLHVYVGADDEDEARQLGSQILANLDKKDELANHCEFLVIEEEV